MNEAQTLQQMKFPNWEPAEVRIVSLTYVLDDPGLTAIKSIKGCKTLAASLDEAVKRARRKYGPGHLNAWGVHCLPLSGWLLGGGIWMRGKHDKNHKEDLRRMGIKVSPLSLRINSREGTATT
jgi:hypothetical protein